MLNDEMECCVWQLILKGPEDTCLCLSQGRMAADHVPNNVSSQDKETWHDFFRRGSIVVLAVFDSCWEEGLVFSPETVPVGIRAMKPPRVYSTWRPRELCRV